MKLEGIHHVTAITADAQRNVDFYAGVLGLRLVKKSVNQDDTSVYHLFYADERGDPGSDLTFFEYPGVLRGRAGAGMIHRVVWRVTGPEALDFWSDRLTAAGYEVARVDSALRPCTAYIGALRRSRRIGLGRRSPWRGATISAFWLLVRLSRALVSINCSTSGRGGGAAAGRPGARTPAAAKAPL